MHEKNFVHMDIKADNVLLKGGRACLTDYTLSFKADGEEGKHFDPEYNDYFKQTAAPEMTLEFKVNFKTDSY